MKTQKAKGIYALKNMSGFDVPYAVFVTGPDIDLYSIKVGLPAFVRPCPMRPRHGFVESRVCNTVADVRAVWQEAKAADPEAELVVMPVIKAQCSAVLAGNRLAIGPGHDGATAGHNVRELKVLPIDWEPEILRQAGIAQSETAYLEIVCGPARGSYTSPRRSYAVQLRAGPELPAGRDYIPATVTVKKVVVPHDDLCRWESEVADFPPGTVVVSPGGSLASHAAVHCVLHGVPFVTSFSPAVGDTIEAVKEEPFKLDTKAFLRGAAIAADRITSNANNACKLAVLVLHHWAALRGSGSEVASSLLGFACRALAIAGVAICAGEARHYSLKMRCQRDSKVGRHQRIDSTLRATPSAQRRALTLAGKAFDGPGWNGGYGGPAWTACAAAVDRLWRSQTDFLDETELVSALNRVVNIAHNNGSLLNKLVDSDYMNWAAAEPTRLLVRQLPLLYDVIVASETAKPARKLPAGRRIKRPAQPKYSHMHVHVEPSGIKAQLWNDSKEYVSHHMSVTDKAVLAWVANAPHLSRSRYKSSDRMYVAIPLTSPIRASNSAVLAAIKLEMTK